MKALSRIVMIGFITVFVHAHALAKPVVKSLVVVTCDCNDLVGTSYVNALRASLAKNAKYTEIKANEGVDQDAIQINIVSMALETGDGPHKSVLSIVCVHNGVILHQVLETCTRIPIQNCADTMLDDLGSWFSSD